MKTVYERTVTAAGKTLMADGKWITAGAPIEVVAEKKEVTGSGMVGAM